MTIRSKLNLSLLGALAITLAISAWIALELIRVEKVVRDNLRVNALNKQVILLNSLTYDYLNAPSRRADIQWHTAYKLLQARLNELRESADHLTRVPAHVADNYSDIDEAFDQIAARQNDPTGAAPPAGLESSLSSLLLKKNQELYDWVLSASDASNKRLLVVMRRDSVLFVALLFVIALGVSTTLWLLKRGLLPSITRLRSGVETIRQGNLNHRIVPVGRDEFGELSSAFNTMAAELQSAQGALEVRNQELRNSEQRFRALVERATDGVVILQQDGYASYVSPSIQWILGYAPGEFLAMDPFELVHPEDVARAREDFRRLLTSSGPIALSARLRHCSGDWRQLEMVGTNLLSLSAVAGVVVNFRDITERQRAEEELRFRNIVFSTQQEVSIDGILVVDDQARILSYNRRFVELWGLPAQLVEARADEPVLQFVTALIADPPSFLQRINYLNEHRQETSQDELILADGRVFDRYSAPMFGPDRRYYGRVWTFRDITERKRVEEALRASEERHRSLFMAMQEGFALHEVICDTAGRPCDYRYLEVNPAFERATGIPRERWIGHTVREVLPQVEDYWIQSFGVVALNGKAATFENYVRELDQHYEVVAYSPKPGLFAVIALNVTDRKRAEHALRVSEEKLRETAQIARVGGWEIDLAGNTLSWTQETFRIHEMATDCAPGLAEAIQFYHPDDQPQVAAAVQRAVESGAGFDFEARLVTAQKNLVWIRAIGTVVRREGHPVSIRGMVQDITDRKRAEEALRESEERFRGILQNVATVAVQGYARDGTVRYWNRASETFYNYTAAEALGRNLLDLIIPPAMHGEVSAAIRRMVETGNPIPAAELALMRKDGSLIPVYSSHAIVTGPGREVELFCIDVDLSARQQAEAEKDKLQAQLTQAQKMDSIGRLAGGVAHDFNNMLQAILGNAALALDQIPPDSPLRENLEEIQKSGQRSADLTRQLLAFARKQTIAPRALDLNETVEGMLKMLRRLIGEHIELAWLPGANLGLVHMDPSQVDQILANLSVNARDAIGGRAGKVSIETGNVRFDEAVVADYPEARAGEYVRLVVSDNGCGMSPEIKAHLFEPFFTTKGIGQGTGLGLATVYGIVKQNHGFISVCSEPGRGTTFKIHLPRHSVRAVPPAGEASAPAPSRGKETILLVEDEPSILRVSQRVLENLGYTVLAASRPGEAIQLAREHVGEIHLLITDVVMPEMNGRDLAKNLLSHHPNLKRLFMSGYTADVIAHHGVLDPAMQFLQKPFSVQALADKVREVLHA